MQYEIRRGKDRNYVPVANSIDFEKIKNEGSVVKATNETKLIAFIDLLVNHDSWKKQWFWKCASLFIYVKDYFVNI